MLIVKVKDGNLEKALKAWKNKVIKTRLIEELWEKGEYTKPSVKRRQTVKDAIYRQKKKEEFDKKTNG